MLSDLLPKSRAWKWEEGINLHWQNLENATLARFKVNIRISHVDGMFSSNMQ